MTRHDLDIYRDIYMSGGKNQSLADIWDKITEALEDHALDHATAEATALLITEWIRENWGGLILNERHAGDPRPAKPQPSTGPELISVATVDVDPLTGSRFAALRNYASEALQKLPVLRPDAAAMAIVTVIRRDYRGRYIPKIRNLSQLHRDHEIWQRANTAAQIEQMARKHDISVVRAYQINKSYQDRRNRLEQPMLPGV